MLIKGDDLPLGPYTVISAYLHHPSIIHPSSNAGNAGFKTQGAGWAVYCTVVLG
ncbi:uncharacterized protein BDW70DRAFT_139905 [Aspergillus foveolatus]|uniref:uncharacterized protein n=1 Tax=Aspergillus foveolatus TaxID=210207 RepID=UPI003CCDE2B1